MARKIEYKGYIIVQSDYNNHVMIADADGRMMMHASCTHRMTDDELRDMIERYVTMTETSEFRRLLAEREGDA